MTIDFDPFAPETGEEYSPEKFYTKAYDKRGHAETLRYGPGPHDTLKVPPWVHAFVSDLRAKCPMFRNNQDVFRDAMIHYLRMRQEQFRVEMPASWHEQVDQLVAIAEIERAQTIRLLHEENLVMMESDLRAATDDAERYAAITRCEQAAMAMTIPSFIRRASDLIDRYRR